MSKVPVVPTEKARLGDKRPIALAVGYSARALAQALSDSGFRVVAVDAFGDYDTCKNSLLTIRLSGWASPKAELSIQPHLWSGYLQGGENETLQDQIPVFLGGGCENWTSLQEHLGRMQGLQVLGPDSDQFTALRKLELWRRAAEFAGMNFPDSFTGQCGTAFAPSSFACITSDDDQQVHGGWLQKSLNSAGGIAVKRLGSDHENAIWAAESLKNSSDSSKNHCRGGVVQREVLGRVLGVTCVVEWRNNNVSSVRLLGATESWQSDDWYGPSEFIYRGSWGPVQLTELQHQQICLFTHYLATSTGVRGLLQIDLIEDPLGRLWILEVNPRWSAGMEILKRSGLCDPIAAHLKAFGYCTEHLRNEANPLPRHPADIEKSIEAGSHGGHTDLVIPIGDTQCSLDFLGDDTSPVPRGVQGQTPPEAVQGQTPSDGICRGQTALVPPPAERLENHEGHTPKLDAGADYEGHTPVHSLGIPPGEHTTPTHPPEGAFRKGLQVGQANRRFTHYIGKAIVYCTREFRLDRDTVNRLHQLDCSHFADIPSIDLLDLSIQSGHPLVSVFVRSDTNLREEEVRLRLLNELEVLQSLALETNRERTK